jgi:alkylhydroperoxidase family enzyme
MSDALIGAIKEGPQAEALTPAEREVMAYTDDLVKNVRAGDATFEPLKERLGYKALQELTITVGYYMLVSRFLETFDVDIEAAPAEVRTSGEAKAS